MSGTPIISTAAASKDKKEKKHKEKSEHKHKEKKEKSPRDRSPRKDSGGQSSSSARGTSPRKESSSAKISPAEAKAPSMAQQLGAANKRTDSLKLESRLAQLSTSKRQLLRDLSKEQIAEYRAAFDMFDGDKDGQITPLELEKTLAEMGATPTQSEIADIIHEFDLDGNGKIDFSEFLVMFALQKDSESDYVAAFKAMDKDGDGFVNHSDMRDMLKHLGIEMSESEAKELFRVTDINKDGKVDAREFTNFMKQTSRTKMPKFTSK